LTASRDISTETAALRLADGRLYHSHSDNVAQLAQRVGERLALSRAELTALRHAALLHDIGKVAIPDEILYKPDTLDARERTIIEQHTLIGERILYRSPALAFVGPIVRSSHEAWDGTGYPDGLAAEAIPLESRIIAVCDAFDAMTNDRPYRSKASIEHARAELAREAGRQFDPTVVGVVLSLTEADEAAA